MSGVDLFVTYLKNLLTDKREFTPITTKLYYHLYYKNERVSSSDTIAHCSDCESRRSLADSESHQHNFPMFMYINFHSKVI